MKTFYINPLTNDLAFDAQNKLQMVDGLQEEEQAIRILLSTNKGEWFLNLLHGLGYKYLQVKHLNEIEAKAEIITTLNQEPRVKDILDVQLEHNRSKRTLTLLVKIKTESGQVMEREVTLNA